MNEPCLKMSGNILGSLYNVELANIWSFAPSIEEWSNISGDLESTAVMQVSDLEVIIQGHFFPWHISSPKRQGPN